MLNQSANLSWVLLLLLLLCCYFRLVFVPQYCSLNPCFICSNTFMLLLIEKVDMVTYSSVLFIPSLALDVDFACLAGSATSAVLDISDIIM